VRLPAPSNGRALLTSQQSANPSGGEMARISPGTIVAGLTAAAVAAIAALAVQASGAAPIARPGNPGGAAAPPSTASSQSTAKAKANALPGGSGSGLRVVYSLGKDRVWLVDAAGKATRTFVVTPGTVDPALGSYTVTSRTAQGLGGDGVSIEHVVRFATHNGVIIGFSAAQDGSLPTPNPAQKTGGIREKRADGTAVWDTAVTGTRVVVVK
jgi:hypothetical protein